MNEKTLLKIKQIAQKAGFPFQVDSIEAEKIIISLAENKPEFLAGELEKIYEEAVQAYDSRGEENDLFYKSESDSADEILAILKIETDYPGLYPSYIIKRGGDTMNEYSVLNAIRQYNNWNHWKES